MKKYTKYESPFDTGLIEQVLKPWEFGEIRCDPEPVYRNPEVGSIGSFWTFAQMPKAVRDVINEAITELPRSQRPKKRYSFHIYRRPLVANAKADDEYEYYVKIF